MCRDHRRCRSSWDEASKLRENARRRVTRNSAKRTAALTAGDEALAAEYSRLIGKAEQDLQHADGMRAAASAEHETSPAEAQSRDVDAAAGDEAAVDTEVLDRMPDDEAPTEAIPIDDDGRVPPDEPMDEDTEAPTDPGADTAPDEKNPVKKPRGRKKREGAEGGASDDETQTNRGSAKEERPLTYQYIDPLEGTPLGQIIKFYRGDYASARTREALDAHGIRYRVDEDGLAISASDWSPETFDVLDGLGFDSLPPRDGAFSGFEWVLPESVDAS